MPRFSPVRDNLYDLFKHKWQVSVAFCAVTITIAYEPVWAIGTGHTASPDQAQEIHGIIRQWLEKKYPSFVAKQLKIQYGGSVKPESAKDIFDQIDVDGGLIGGASLKPDDFIEIIKSI